MMTRRTFRILLALAEGPAHGYGIRGRVEERTDGAVKPGSGGPPRRFYALTDRGRASLRAELRRMDEAVTLARSLDLLPERS